MIAIYTKFIAPTNVRGSRIKAYTVGYGDQKGHSATIPVPHELSHEIRHFQAVKELVRKNKLDWDLTEMRYGDSPDKKGYVFCFNHSIVKEA